MYSDPLGANDTWPCKDLCFFSCCLQTFAFGSFCIVLAYSCCCIDADISHHSANVSRHVWTSLSHTASNVEYSSSTIPVYILTLIPSSALCIILVAMMRSKEIKTSRLVLMLIL